MTPNIASVISSASSANGSASAFLFAAASEPEAAFSVLFPKPTRVERRPNVSHKPSTSIPPTRSPLPPPTRSLSPVSGDGVSSHSNRAARARRARSRRFLTFVVFLPRAAAHTPTRHDHTSSVSAHIPLPPPPPRARSPIIRPQRPPRAHRVRGRVPARIARHRPRASVPRPHRRVHTARTHAPSLELARGTDALRFVARVVILSARETSSSAGASFPSTLPAAHQP